MSFGDGDLHDRVRQLEQLVRDMHRELDAVRNDVFLMEYIEKRMAELGIGKESWAS